MNDITVCFFPQKINKIYDILTSSNFKFIQKLKDILENNIIDDQSKTLLSLINHIAESINKIINIRYNLLERTNINNDVKFLLNDDLLTDISQQSCFQSILEKEYGDEKEDYADHDKEEDNDYKENISKEIYKKSLIQNNTQNHVTGLDRSVKRLPKEITLVLNEW